MIVALILVAGATFSSARPDTVQRASIQQAIGALVRIDTVPGPPGEGSVRVVGFNVDSHTRSPLLSDFLRDHGRLLWYLATHTRGAEARMLGDRDSAYVVRDSIVSALIASQVFNERVFAMLGEYWRPRGRVIAGIGAGAPQTPITITRLAQIGARFFYPDRFSTSGDTMFTHICAGINGISDLAEVVDPILEAFVFVAVTSDLFVPHAPLMLAFERASKRAKVTSASKDAATRVRRAQGALWAQLEESPALRRALARAYVAHRTVLPFRLAEGT